MQIGQSLLSNRGNIQIILFNDAIVKKENIAELITDEWSNNENIRYKRWVSLKADKNCDMGTISDIKQELRKGNALKINYSTTVRTGN